MPAAMLLQKFEKVERSSTDELVEALRNVVPLEGLEQADYEWLAEHGKECVFPAGECMFHQDQAAECMYIFLRGEVQVRRVRGNQTNVFVGRAGDVSGLMPYSRMKNYGGEGIATQQTWLLAIHKSKFADMMRQVPALQPRLVSVLLDRVREVTRMEQQAEKLQSLNKLAGNLAHELNNPASAAQRSASHLLQELGTYGRQKFALGQLCLPDEKLDAVRAWEQAVMSRDSAQSGGSLQQSDHQVALENWLLRRGVASSGEISVMLAECGVLTADLDQLATQIDANTLSVYVAQLASSLRTRKMTEAVLGSTGRIFEIINAIKDYSYLDQAPLQQVDIPQSLRSALAMLQSRTRRIEVVENFPARLQCITAFGSEINQVWTALLENAVDAMEGIGRLELAARCEDEWMIVEIRDNGSGIAPEIRDRIFEPFFTTKAVGKGLGLGLDTAMRIVRKHRGMIAVESVQGDTCFTVRLPMDQGRAY